MNGSCSFPERARSYRFTILDRLPKMEKNTLRVTILTSCMNFRMIQAVIKCFEGSTVERIEENSNDFSRCLCTGHFQNRPSPPRANPGAFDFFEKFWSNSPLCYQFRRQMPHPLELQRGSNPPPCHAMHS